MREIFPTANMAGQIARNAGAMEAHSANDSIPVSEDSLALLFHTQSQFQRQEESFCQKWSEKWADVKHSKTY